MRVAICGLLGCCALLGQAVNFDVASVKRSSSIGGPFRSDPGQIAYTGMTLRSLLMAAYLTPRFQIDGPAWLDTEHYDVIAKVPPGATQEQRNQMLQNLLVERFRMMLHRETRQMDAYILSIARNGANLKRSAIPPGEPGVLPPQGPPKYGPNGIPVLEGRGLLTEMVQTQGVLRAYVVAKGQPVLGLAQTLALRIGSPVLDQTGLADEFDFTLFFDPQLLRNGAAEAPSGDPDIFAAIQEQLGLKLDGKKAPVEILVIDGADKVPTQD